MDIHVRFQNPELIFSDSYLDDVEMTLLEDVDSEDDLLEELEILEESDTGGWMTVDAGAHAFDCVT